MDDLLSIKPFRDADIDFITEFDGTGKSVESCIMINQSISGCKCIKVSTDGSTVSTLNVLNSSRLFQNHINK